MMGARNQVRSTLQRTTGGKMAERAGTNRLATAQRFLLNIGHPNIEQAIGALTPQVTYRVPGRHGLAGTIVGRDEVARHLSDLVDQTLGTFDAVKWDDWLIGEHYVAGLAQIHVQRNGRLFSGRVVYTVKFNSADLIEAVEIFVEDERSFSDFFAN
jgi:hypothetical protein